MTEEAFQKLSMYHKLLHPCTQAVKFFEQDHISLCHVYPALKTLKRHFNEQAAIAEAECPELLEGWHSLRHYLRFRQYKLLDRDLVKAAFSLTSFGCTWLAIRNELIPSSHQLQLAHESPRKLFVIGPLDATLNVATPGGELAHNNEDEGQECAYLRDIITDESLEEAARMYAPRGPILTFLREILVKYLREELPASDANCR
jgi:hypothetical protein